MEDTSEMNGIDMPYDDVIEESVFAEDAGMAPAPAEEGVIYQLPISLHHHGYARAPTWANKQQGDDVDNGDEQLSPRTDDGEVDEPYLNGTNNYDVSDTTGSAQSHGNSSAAQLAPTLFSHLTGQNVLNDPSAADSNVETEIVMQNDEHVYDEGTAGEDQVIVDSEVCEQTVESTADIVDNTEQVQDTVSRPFITKGLIRKSDSNVLQPIAPAVRQAVTRQTKPVMQTPTPGKLVSLPIGQKSYVQIQPAQGKGAQAALSTGQTLPVSLLLKLQQQGIQVAGLPSGTVQVSTKKDDPVRQVATTLNETTGELEVVDKQASAKQQMQRIIIIQQPSGGQSLLISGAPGAQPTKSGRTIIMPASSTLGSSGAPTLSSLISAAGNNKPRVVIRGGQHNSRRAGDYPVVVNELEDETVAAEIEVDDDGLDKSKRKRGRKPRVMTKQLTAKKSKKLAALALGRKRGKRNRDSDATDEEEEDLSRPQSPSSGQDENLMLELLETRRSGRQVKRKRYFDDIDLNLSDDDKQTDAEETEVDVGSVETAGGAGMDPDGAHFFVDNPNEDEANVVDKILGMRVVKRPKLKDYDAMDILTNEALRDGMRTPPACGDQVMEGAQSSTSPEKREGFWRSRIASYSGDDRLALEEVEEFYVKYKNFSYLHCEWKTANELERGDKRIHMKIRRFKIKQAQQPFMAQLDEDELFNQEYIEVERILDVSVAPDSKTGQEVTYYLVKWRSLPYEDSTWELAEDVTTDKVEEFNRYHSFPPEEEQEYVERPSSEEWCELDISPQFENGNELRGYQLEGLNWLLFCFYNQQNCILADEMGLGKTIQSIAFLHEVAQMGIRGPFLVVAPLSTIQNWQREFDLWSRLNVIVYHGTTQSRTMIQEYDMFYKDEQGRRILDFFKFHVLITTYEIIIADCELLSQIQWRVAVIDEAHRLKNKNCRLLEGLKMFDLDHSVLLTGTPLQNNVEELFSLLNFLEPKRFSSLHAFLADFGTLRTEAQVEKLKALLKPMMLRRLKVDVEKSLAPKEETVIEVELTNIQKKYYRAILERNFQHLSKGTTTANVPNLLNTMMELRKCCNHPFLITGAEEQILDDVRQGRGTELQKQQHMFQVMVQSSGKLVLIDKLLPRLKADNHKVLIFSQMIRVLDILEDYLLHNRYAYERLDGRIRGNLRQEAIDRFCKPDSDRFVFLLCTRAGGLGINLTAADTVIIYDSDWNPQNDLQAQARCHRIGQEKAVKVYRLVTRNSYEREMFDRASLKLGLDRAVLQSTGSKETANSTAQLSKREIEDLLRKGAYGALMDDENAGDKFCDEDIEQILQRRARVVTIATGEKGSTFSKASFATSSARTDIDIDDPEFWQKWAKRADIDVNNLNSKSELIIEEPRQRKQTTRYGKDKEDMSMSEGEYSGVDVGAEEDDEGGKRGRRGRRPGQRGRRRKDGDDRMSGKSGYMRSDFFKTEKQLLVYGWGRWEDIIQHARYKHNMAPEDVENVARALLMYSLKQYAGDERIKQFIFDLIKPNKDGQQQDLRKHSGLSAPVPRGRKGRKIKEKAAPVVVTDMMSKTDLDPERILKDEGYKKHLKRHANKVLLRVRLLYYLKQEVIGEEAEKIFCNAPASEIDIPAPIADGELPAYWWDEDADRSLLIGVFKHGYEKYNLIRQDPALDFLHLCGPPDEKALLAEQKGDDDDKDDGDDKELDVVDKKKDDDDGEADSPKRPAVDEDASQQSTPGTEPGQQSGDNGKLPFPGPSELNTRLRRVITGYQRGHKKEQQKEEKKARRAERREKFQAVLKERQKQKRDQQQRWSRREETDFYRVVSTFGVERDPKSKVFKWDTFRMLAHLEKKYDDTMTAYFKLFYNMCKRVCGRLEPEEEAAEKKMMSKAGEEIHLEPITEERASRCLARIELLNRIREDILPHPKLDERLKLCQKTLDLPDWWIAGEHDGELLIGAAKHGLAKTDVNILYDPDLAFREIASARMKSFVESFPGGLPQDFVEAMMRGEKPDFLTLNRSDQTADGEEMKTELKGEAADGSVREEETVDSTIPVTVSEHVPVKQEEASNSAAGKVHPTAGSSTDGPDGVKVSPDIKMPLPAPGYSKPSPDQKSGQLKMKFLSTEGGGWKSSAVGGDKHKFGGMHGSDTDSDDDSSRPKMLPPGFNPLTGAFNKNSDPDMQYAEWMASELMGRAWSNPAIMWPKDRAIFFRLENVCHCIETGEWPTPRRYAQTGGYDVPQLLKTVSTLGGHDYAMFAGMPDPKSAPKRRRKIKADSGMPHSRSHLMPYGGLSDNESDLSFGADPGDYDSRQQSPYDNYRRGEKRKYSYGTPDELAYKRMAMADRSRMLMSQGRPGSDEGSRPMSDDDDDDDDDDDEDRFEDSRAVGKVRKRRVNPLNIDPENVEGTEHMHIAMVNRETGKRITGARAPPLRNLTRWLERNPAFDIDPKWMHIVNAWGGLPDHLKRRVASANVMQPHSGANVSMRGGRGGGMTGLPRGAMTQRNTVMAVPRMHNPALAGMRAIASMLPQRLAMAGPANDTEEVVEEEEIDSELDDDDSNASDDGADIGPPTAGRGGATVRPPLVANKTVGGAQQFYPRATAGGVRPPVVLAQTVPRPMVASVMTRAPRMQQMSRPVIVSQPVIQQRAAAVSAPVMRLPQSHVPQQRMPPAASHYQQQYAAMASQSHRPAPASKATPTAANGPHASHGGTQWADDVDTDEGEDGEEDADDDGQ